MAEATPSAPTRPAIANVTIGRIGLIIRDLLGVVGRRERSALGKRGAFRIMTPRHSNDASGFETMSFHRGPRVPGVQVVGLVAAIVEGGAGGGEGGDDEGLGAAVSTSYSA